MSILSRMQTILGWCSTVCAREPLAQAAARVLRVLYDGIDDFDVDIEGGTVQVFFHEGSYTVPATRLSDGTLRYLCLLAILCHPQPGPLVCIEEPELGLHPDVLPTLAALLKEASERTQLIVTTHSDVLVDAFTDMPEAVLVAGRSKHGTALERLSPEILRPWLEKYRLGQLWTRGDIGGTCGKALRRRWWRRGRVENRVPRRFQGVHHESWPGKSAAYSGLWKPTRCIRFLLYRDQCWRGRHVACG